MTGNPLVSIVIPHFNGKEILHGCLQALGNTKYENKEIIVVNNASTDDSLDNIEQSFPLVRLVNNGLQLGKFLSYNRVVWVICHPLLQGLNCVVKTF